MENQYSRRIDFTRIALNYRIGSIVTGTGTVQLTCVDSVQTLPSGDVAGSLGALITKVTY